MILIISIIIILLAVYFFYIKKEYYQHDPKIDKLKSLVSKLDPNFNDISIYKGKSSFTLNKKNIYMCLYDKNGKYYSDNMLIYVLIHEIAHVINKHDTGHTPTFYRIFDRLLIEADQIGIYDISTPPIENYCGT